MHIHVHHGTKSTLGPLVTRQERVLFVLFIVRSLLFSDLEARLLKQWWPQHWLQDQTQTSHSCGSFLRFLTLAETKKSVNPKTPQPELIETIFPAPCLAFPAFQVVFFTTLKPWRSHPWHPVRPVTQATSLGTVADDDQRTLCETIDALKTGEDRFNHPQARRDRQNDTFELPVVWSPLELIIYQHLHHGSNSISVHRKSIESSTSLRRFIH